MMIDRIDGIARAGASGAPGDERERRRRAVPHATPAAAATIEEPAAGTIALPVVEPVASFLAEVARLAGSDGVAARTPDVGANADGIALRMRGAAAQAIGAQARLGAAGVHALLAEGSGGIAGSR